MSPLLDIWTEAVAGALTKHATAVTQPAPRRWIFALSRDSALALHSHLTPEWLLFDALLPSGLGPTHLGLEVFAVNSALPAGLRLCTAGLDSRLRLRLEIPVLECTPIAPRLERLCTSLAVMEKWLIAGGAKPCAPLESAPAGYTDCDLEQLCRETGWPFTVREGGAVSVELDVPNAYQRAMVTCSRDRGLLIFTPVLAEAPPVPACVAAVVHCALAVTGAVRMTSAVRLEDVDGGIGFSVRFEQPPTAEELGHAFAALSVAWRCGGRELGVLAHDEAIARLYAAASGAEPQESKLERTNT